MSQDESDQPEPLIPNDERRKPTPRHAKPGEVPRLFLTVAEQVRIARRISRKIGGPRYLHRRDFYPLLCFMLRKQWHGFSGNKFVVTDNNWIIAEVLSRKGRKWDEPRRFLGLCTLQYAIETICALAEEQRLTVGERAFLLNQLPIEESDSKREENVDPDEPTDTAFDEA